jgi:hypothetical protein
VLLAQESAQKLPSVHWRSTRRYGRDVHPRRVCLTGNAEDAVVAEQHAAAAAEAAKAWKERTEDTTPGTQVDERAFTINQTSL